MILDNLERGSKMILFMPRNIGKNTLKKEIDKLVIVPSDRIDWCEDCQTEHGYHCPKEDI